MFASYRGCLSECCFHWLTLKLLLKEMFSLEQSALTPSTATTENCKEPEPAAATAATAADPVSYNSAL